MSRKVKLFLALLLGLGLVVISIYYFNQHPMVVLTPGGEIGRRQLQIMVASALMSLIVIVPVFIMAFSFRKKYLETNTASKYEPNMSGNKKLEFIWWLVPICLISILSIITWRTSHTLDPFKPLSDSKNNLKIEVVALESKWLFIYPEQNLATVNYVVVPVERPINFVITADAPMNSFWIPELGGQIYAMAGMRTQLNLRAEKAKTFRGLTANISGRDFARMTFEVKAVGQADFDSWQYQARQSTKYLDHGRYHMLNRPELGPEETFNGVWSGLFDHIVSEYAPFSYNKHEDNHD